MGRFKDIRRRLSILLAASMLTNTTLMTPMHNTNIYASDTTNSEYIQRQVNILVGDWFTITYQDLGYSEATNCHITCNKLLEDGFMDNRSESTGYDSANGTNFHRAISYTFKKAGTCHLNVECNDGKKFRYTINVFPKHDEELKVKNVIIYPDQEIKLEDFVESFRYYTRKYYDVSNPTYTYNIQDTQGNSIQSLEVAAQNPGTYNINIIADANMAKDAITETATLTVLKVDVTGIALENSDVIKVKRYTSIDDVKSQLCKKATVTGKRGYSKDVNLSPSDWTSSDYNMNVNGTYTFKTTISLEDSKVTNTQNIPTTLTQTVVVEKPNAESIENFNGDDGASYKVGVPYGTSVENILTNLNSNNNLPIEIKLDDGTTETYTMTMENLSCSNYSSVIPATYTFTGNLKNILPDTIVIPDNFNSTINLINPQKV